MTLNIPVLMHWFSYVGDSSNYHTGMWVVQHDHNGSPPFIINLDSVVHAAHLLPVFGPGPVLTTLSFTDTLDRFTQFYINKFIDHNTFKTVFLILYKHFILILPSSI
jgi:hypothetical protein